MYAQMVKSTGETVVAKEKLSPKEREFQDRIDRGE